MNDAGDYATAMRLYTECLQLQSAAGTPVNGARTAQTYNGMGITARHLGDRSLALEYHRKALKIRLDTFGPKHKETADSYVNIGIIYGDLENGHDASEGYFRKALDIFLATAGESCRSVERVYANLGNLALRLKKYDLALEHFCKALDILNTLGLSKHPCAARTFHSMGATHQANGDQLAAREYYSKAHVIAREVLGDGHPLTTIYKRALDRVGSVVLNPV
jgi:tetratricopeptide (TPR) repeat protein